MIRYTVLGAFFMLLPFYELRGTDNKNNKKMRMYAIFLCF